MKKSTVLTVSAALVGLALLSRKSASPAPAAVGDVVPTFDMSTLINAGLGCDEALGCADGVGCAEGMGCADDGMGATKRYPTKHPKNSYRSPPIIARPSSVGYGPHFMRNRGWGGQSGLHDYEGVNGLADMEGLGFSLKKSIKKISKAPSHAIKKALAPVKKQVAKANKVLKKELKKPASVLKRELSKASNFVKQGVKKALAPVKRDFTNASNLLRSTDPLFKKLAPLDHPTEHPGDDETGTPTTYVDTAGNEITQEEFDRLNAETDAYNDSLASMEASAPGEIQFDQSTGIYWAQDSAGNWHQWMNNAWILEPSQETAADSSSNQVDYAQDTYTPPASEWNDEQFDTANTGGDTDAIQDPATGVWWYQAQDGAWWYMQNGAWVQEEAGLDEQVAEDRSYADSLVENKRDQETSAIWDEGTGLYWTRDAQGDWWWWSTEVKEWQPDVAMQPMVAEQENGGTGKFLSWLFDWKGGGMGHLTNRETGNRLYILRTLGNSVESIPIMADKKGKLFAANGGGMSGLGCVDDLAGAGLGFKLFGRTYGEIRGNVDNIAKDIASKSTPSGALYKYVKEKHPKVFREYRRETHSATPYALIVGGTVLSVAGLATGGAASAGGVAMIAAGVAEVGAQGYSDYEKHQAANEIRHINAQGKDAEREALISAGNSAVNSRDEVPASSWTSWDWWLGTDLQNTYGGAG